MLIIFLLYNVPNLIIMSKMSPKCQYAIRHVSKMLNFIYSNKFLTYASININERDSYDRDSIRISTLKYSAVLPVNNLENINSE